MDDPLGTSLIVTGIGMLVLFLALAFLTGLMYLMTALIKDRTSVTDPMAEEPRDVKPTQEAALRAAMIAVALARAERELSSVDGPDKAASAWRTLHHQRQLTRNIRTTRRQ